LVDKILIGRKLAQLDTYLGQLREFHRISVKTYKEDWKKQRIVERTLQILIEVFIDIANHIISDKGLRLPKISIPPLSLNFPVPIGDQTKENRRNCRGE